MNKKLNRKFWYALVIFSFVGQIAWVIENMYFNVFIYKMFNASAGEISIMVGASAITATLTTLLLGALSDKLGKRKIFISLGYILWGCSIVVFCFIRQDVLSSYFGIVANSLSIGVSIVIIMDCVMTFFGSTANDACFNAWMTECGDSSNRGKIEGINSMMPLIAMLAVFGGFMAFDLNLSSSWTYIFAIVGGVVVFVGLLGLFLIEEKKDIIKTKQPFLENLKYIFKPNTVRENNLLYIVTLAFAVFGISIQIFMPYLILYYEVSLNITNYVIIMAPAIVLAALFTVLYGKLYDMLGFKTAAIPMIAILGAGYIILYFSTHISLVFIGSLLMMCGFLSGMACFGAKIRDLIPKDRTGQFQALRIIGQVLIPGVVGPAIGAFLLRNASTIVNSDGTVAFIPNRIIFLGALAVLLLLTLLMIYIYRIINLTFCSLPMEGQVDWTKYPRPQMRRNSFFSLNGQWSINGEKVVVPFPPESILSKYGRKPGTEYTYEKKFVLPRQFANDKVFLHFGAVDQIATVVLNGVELTTHEGGYLPFSVDITEAVDLKEENTLVVKVIDKLSTDYPYGKQRKKRGGMWYTDISGIWQSVWIESVPNIYIKNVKITTTMTKVKIDVDTNAKEFTVKLPLEEFTITRYFSEKHVEIDMTDIDLPNGEKFVPTLWTPENPKLYEIGIIAAFDRVDSYYALREVNIQNVDGIDRVCLNNEPVFFKGVLDQGYFPNGIFTPFSEEGYEQDVLAMKELGFNTIRKHIKVEPEWFYYYCDKHGMMVVQDMVNSGKYSFFKDTAMPTIGMVKQKDKTLFGKKRKEFFINHCIDTVVHLYNHPCIVGYTIFNEGWGQFDSDSLYVLLKDLDGTRIFDSTSGWFAQSKSDVESMHVYFKTIRLPVTKKPLFLSECGGYSYVVNGHVYSKYNHYGYGSCDNEEELTDAYEEMCNNMVLPAIPNGLCGFIYTQLSDVEDETNGLYTYDRQICKVNKDRMKEINNRLKIR